MFIPGKKVNLPSISRDERIGVMGRSKIMFQVELITTSSPSTGRTKVGQEVGSLQYLVPFSTTKLLSKSAKHAPTHLSPVIKILFLELFLPLTTNSNSRVAVSL